MTRTLFIAALLASSAIGVASVNAQDTKCGPVAYDQAKQMYVGIPCNAGGQNATAQPTDPNTAKAAPKCGPVAYDQATQTYVGVPCAAATTDENPAGRSQ